jgi:AAA15 family ATPase/GTPase
VGVVSSEGMLLSLSVGNFRSFWDEQTLSMVAGPDDARHEEHLRVIPQDVHRALPIAVIYGANGAGKSNLVKAMAMLLELVVVGTEPKKPIRRDPFLLNDQSESRPTTVSVQFVQEGMAFEYGCHLQDTHVEAEWLSTLANGAEHSVYERGTDQQGEAWIRLGPGLPDQDRDRKLRALVQVGVPQNQLFLQAIRAHLSDASQGAVLGRVVQWFDRVRIIHPQSRFELLARLVAGDPNFADFAGSFLKEVSTGVDRLDAHTIEVDAGELTKLSPDVLESINRAGLGKSISVGRSDGAELIVEKGEGTRLSLRTVQAQHVTPGGRRIGLDFKEESDGTRRLTELLPALFVLGQKHQSWVFVIDEIDRSLHPLLAKRFVREFLRRSAGSGNQLVLTTHETALLDMALMRRDEIWFANKRLPDGSTELYSLSEYPSRPETKVDRSYLEGRFEAVPPSEAELPEWVRQISEELRRSQTGTKPGVA